jgi:hypothetical protein
MKVAMTLDGRIAPPPASMWPASPTGSPAKPPAPPCSRCAGRPTPRSPASIPCWPTTPAHRPQRPAPPPAAAARGAGLGPAHAARLQDGGHGAQRCGHLHRLQRRGPHPRAAQPRRPRRSAARRSRPRSARKVLDKLGEEGILTLLTETGTRLNTALLAGGLVDRVHLFVSPQIMGSDAVPAFRGMPSHPHGRSRSRALWQRPRLARESSTSRPTSQDRRTPREPALLSGRVLARYAAGASLRRVIRPPLA